jgi:hypothetical protein
MLSPTEYKVVIGNNLGREVWECDPNGCGIWAYTRVLDEEEKARLI